MREDYCTFERDKPSFGKIPTKPDGGEVAPAKLSNHMVAVVVKIANFDGVITALNLHNGNEL